MKYFYPVVLTPTSDGWYAVYVPDLEIDTQGKTVADALDMARDAIGLWGVCEEDAGRKIPTPSLVTPKHEDDELVSLVEIDFASYRDMNDNRLINILTRV